VFSGFALHYSPYGHAQSFPEEAAQGIFRERYEGARVVFLGGSLVRGEATPASDLDIVVVRTAASCLKASARKQ
jgi:predicted nucleotidyltransferase